MEFMANNFLSSLNSRSKGKCFIFLSNLSIFILFFFNEKVLHSYQKMFVQAVFIIYRKYIKKKRTIQPETYLHSPVFSIHFNSKWVDSM